MDDDDPSLDIFFIKPQKNIKTLWCWAERIPSLTMCYSVIHYQRSGCTTTVYQRSALKCFGIIPYIQDADGNSRARCAFQMLHGKCRISRLNTSRIIIAPPDRASPKVFSEGNLVVTIVISYRHLSQKPDNLSQLHMNKCGIINLKDRK